MTRADGCALASAVDLFGRHTLTELTREGLKASKLKEYNFNTATQQGKLVEKARRRLELLPAAQSALEALSAGARRASL